MLWYQEYGGIREMFLQSVGVCIPEVGLDLSPLYQWSEDFFAYVTLGLSYPRDLTQ